MALRRRTVSHFSRFISLSLCLFAFAFSFAAQGSFRVVRTSRTPSASAGRIKLRDRGYNAHRTVRAGATRAPARSLGNGVPSGLLSHGVEGGASPGLMPNKRPGPPRTNARRKRCGPWCTQGRSYCETRGCTPPMCRRRTSRVFSACRVPRKLSTLRSCMPKSVFVWYGMASPHLRQM